MWDARTLECQQRAEEQLQSQPETNREAVDVHWLEISGVLPTHPQVELEEKPTKSVPPNHISESFPQWHFAYSCKKGLKVSTANQDDFSILRSEEKLVLGVFDGHGEAGHKVANFVQGVLTKEAMRLPTTSESETQTTWTNVFLSCQKQVEACASQEGGFNSVLSGTTATIVVISDTRLVAGHVGDSRAVLGRKSDSGEWTAVELTRSHKPDIPEEKKRIESKGGVVRTIGGDSTHRICLKTRDSPGLAMSRSIGDTFSKGLGAVAIPDVLFHDISSEDEFILICSDGIWDFISDLEAVKIVSTIGRTQCVQAGESLSRLAWTRWVASQWEYVDDLTVLLAYLHR